MDLCNLSAAFGPLDAVARRRRAGARPSVIRAAMLALLVAPPAVADPARVEAARLTGATVEVTISHPDTGWDHYADGWEVITADGTRLGLRRLAHPHVAEQPFTRSLTLDAPPPPGPLFIRTRCSRDGWPSTRTPVLRD